MPDLMFAKIADETREEMGARFAGTRADAAEGVRRGSAFGLAYESAVAPLRVRSVFA